MLLKQSTAVTIPFGPFVSQTDGVTLSTGLVSAIDNGTTGIKLSKNGGALTIRHASVTASTYDAYGNYLITLDTTDTNTLGSLRVQFADATTNLPVWADYQVVPANVYDSLVGGSTGLKVDVDTIKTQAVTCAAGVTVLASVGTASTSTAQTGDCFARLTGTGAVTFASLAVTGTTTFTGAVTGTSASNDMRINGAVPGASGGLLISGSNSGTTTLGALTVSGATTLAALSMTTLTASGAVAFQSTFAVTTSTSLAALSCTTLTASGAVAFQSTFATTGTTTFNALTVTNAFTVSGATTFTGAVTGTNAGNDLRINGAVPGAAGGLFIAGTNAATTVTTSFTTTFTGNLTGSVGSVTTVSDKTGYSLANGSFVTATFGTCDFTSTMKTSIGVAVAASAVASVTGNVGGSVGSVTGLTASNLDVAISTRMATYTQPTGFLAAAFPGTVASTTNITSAAGVTLADGAITDAKIAFPAESAGRPTTFLAAMRRVWEWATNKRTRDRGDGTVVLRNAADDGTLETQTQSTVGTSDSQSKGA